MKRRHLVAVENKVRRVRDRQNEARGVGDKRADDEIRQRLSLRGLGGGINGWGKDNRCCIVRKKGGHDDADCVDEAEKPCR